MTRPKWVKGWVLNDDTRQWERVYHDESQQRYRAKLGPQCAPNIDHLIRQQYVEAGFSDEQIAELDKFTDEQVEVILAKQRLRKRRKA